MALFAVHCLDGANAAAARSAHREAHFAHVEANLHRYAVAGPLRDGTGTIIGSLLVIEASDVSDARSFLDQDPYARAGIWQSIRIDAFTAAAGTWIGGTIWQG